MIKQEFLIHDSKAIDYTLFQQATIETGVRYFQTLVNTPGNPINAHPADYTLFHRGSYDTESGASTQLEAKESLFNGLDLVDPAVPVPLQPIDGGQPESHGTRRYARSESS